jgi:hypothetical protein
VVTVVDPIPGTSLLPAGIAPAASDNAEYFRKVVKRFELEKNAALLIEGTRETIGLPYGEIARRARQADLLIDISGTLLDAELFEPAPTRIYLDIDPVFNQLWQAAEGIDRHFAGHTHFATVGPALAGADSPVPTCGLPWIPTVPPVVLSAWPVAGPIVHDALTTIANWRGYGSIEYEGVLYGQKAHSLRQLFDLPSRTSEHFLLALSIHPGETKDLAALDENGWRLADPTLAAGDPDTYREFIQASKAEFGVAKSGYVAGRSGWFSDRSVCYLASGRPVIAQDTGFSRYLPTGEGLFAFRTGDDALAAIDEVNGDYARHSRAAREIAEQHFDSRLVLSRLLDAVGAPA